MPCHWRNSTLAPREMIHLRSRKLAALKQIARDQRHAGAVEPDQNADMVAQVALVLLFTHGVEHCADVGIVSRAAGSGLLFSSRGGAERRLWPRWRRTISSCVVTPVRT